MGNWGVSGRAQNPRVDRFGWKVKASQNAYLIKIRD